MLKLANIPLLWIGYHNALVSTDKEIPGLFLFNHDQIWERILHFDCGLQ